VRTPAMSGCRQADDPSPQNRRLPRRIRETYGRKPELFTRMCKGTAVAARYPPVGPQGADIRLKVGSRSTLSAGLQYSTQWSNFVLTQRSASNRSCTNGRRESSFNDSRRNNRRTRETSSVAPKAATRRRSAGSMMKPSWRAHSPL